MHNTQDFTITEELFARAVAKIPGGVNSPVRSFKAVGRLPVFAAKGQGSRLIDVDGNSFVDFVMSYGPLIFGHAPNFIVKAVHDAAINGTTFGATTLGEVQLAELLCELVPSFEKVRLVNSGTEAVMSAIRVARGFTGRSKVIKFEGCYHGHSDGLLAKAGSGVATLSLPDSSGVPANLTIDTVVLPYNCIETFKDYMLINGREVAAVIVEPVAANMGVVLPKTGFLETLREYCTRDSAVLIFDEIISGFRLGLGGAQELLGIIPDMTTIGKIAGGGLPLAAYGGKAEIMDFVAPVGPVYQAGTLSGNPIAVSSGLAMIRYLKSNPTVYSDLEHKMQAIVGSVAEYGKHIDAHITVNQIGSLATIFFTQAPVVNFETALTSDRVQYARFFSHLFQHGVLVAPSQFEAMFVSTAHSLVDLEQTHDTMQSAIRYACG